MVPFADFLWGTIPQAFFHVFATEITPEHGRNTPDLIHIHALAAALCR